MAAVKSKTYKTQSFDHLLWEHAFMRDDKATWALVARRLQHEASVRPAAT